MCRTRGLVLAAIIFAFLALTNPGYSADYVKLYVSPSSIVDYSYFPGVTFTINVSVVDVFDLRACKFNLSYNGGVLGCFGMLVGPSENEPYDINFGWNASGEIWFSVLYRVPLTSENSVTLSTIFFSLLRLGEKAHFTFMAVILEIPLETSFHVKFLMGTLAILTHTTLMVMGLLICWMFL